jgi:hypothetical protein
MESLAGDDEINALRGQGGGLGTARDAYEVRLARQLGFGASAHLGIGFHRVYSVAVVQEELG